MFEQLVRRPYDYIVFLLLTLKDVPRAWTEAHRIGLDSPDLWARLVDACEGNDPAAVIPVLQRLVESDLRVADAGNYKTAASRLDRVRTLATRTGTTADAEALVAEIRHRYRNRPRLIKELDKAGL